MNLVITKQAPSRPTHRLLQVIGRCWPVLLILPIFVALGGLYSATTPIFEVPDEPLHYHYIKWLADGQGLPPLTVVREGWEYGQMYQPPLYYALGALLTAPIQTGPADALYQRNPFSAAGLPHAYGNKNAVLHQPDEGFPYQGVSLAVHLLRWLSILCSAGTVLFAYLVALQVAPKRRDIAAGAAVLTAFNPQFLFLSAGVNNSALLILFSTIALYLALRVANGWDHPRRTPILLGLFVGLAALTSQGGLATILLVAGAYLIRAHQDGHRNPRVALRAILRPVSVALGVVLLVAGWWYVRNTILYHDPLALHAWQATIPARGTFTLSDTLNKLVGSIISYWGVFGWMNVLTDEIFYAWVRAFTLVGLVGIGILAARTYWRRRTLRDQRWRAFSLLVGWVIVILAVLVVWTLSGAGPQGRLMFPAIAAISLLIFAGLTGWMFRHLGGVLALLVGLIFAGLSAIIPFHYIAPAYAQPQRITLDQVPTDLQPLDIYFGDKLFLLGYQVPDDNVEAGESLRVRLYWLDMKRMEENYTFSVQIFGRQDERIGGVDTYPGKGNYPTSLWVPGEVVVEDYTVPIAAGAQVPAAGIIRVGVYESSTSTRLVPTDARGRELTCGPKIGRVRVAPRSYTIYTPEVETKVNLGDKVLLAGYDLPTGDMTPGEQLPVVLYWKPLSSIMKDYTVFMHLLDEDGNQVAQVDEQPIAGDYPTSLWMTDEIVRDTHYLTLPADLAEGDYTLHIGLYWLETGERLPLVDANPPMDYEEIGPVHVGNE